MRGTNEFINSSKDLPYDSVLVMRIAEMYIGGGNASRILLPNETCMQRAREKRNAINDGLVALRAFATRYE